MERQQIPGQTIGGLKIVVAALMMGIVIFVVVVAIVKAQNLAAMPPGMEIVVYIGLGMLVIAVVLQFIVLSAVDAATLRQVDSPERDDRLLMSAYCTRTIVGCALIEGAAFMCVMGAMLDGRPIGLIAGSAAAAVMGILHWPTDAKWNEFAERHRLSG
jgi:hypothetical protein